MPVMFLPASPRPSTSSSSSMIPFMSVSYIWRQIYVRRDGGFTEEAKVKGANECSAHLKNQFKLFDHIRVRFL